MGKKAYIILHIAADIIMTPMIIIICLFSVGFHDASRSFVISMIVYVLLHILYYILGYKKVKYLDSADILGLSIEAILLSPVSVLYLSSVFHR